MKGVLQVFAKAPIPGQVKTRLISALGVNRATHLYMRLVHHTLITAIRSSFERVELWCSPTSTHDFFSRCAATYGISLRTQKGLDLGARMAHALSNGLTSHDSAVLIGCDCPALTSADIDRSARLLSEGYDAALGPAQDGGYVLIGLTKFSPFLFNDIPWGTDSVLGLTRTRLSALRWRWHELPERWDVDRPGDLFKLAREPARPASKRDTRDEH
ncbi:MAG: TIGR04282 family arsenosugar biosynthesis glycosyltransferase [Gammaproteobacteria bacterium]|nr:TIGR04282 family arsenosugar biosynthesis glycosyltransferase [Gammaproteobacteria bacterium]